MSRSGLSNWQRMLLYTLGASIGAILAVLYVKKRLKEQDRPQKLLSEPASSPIIVPGGERRLAPRPPQAITLKAAGEPHEIEAARLSLSLEASPEPFKRRQAGTIIATTEPGAACTINAVYSTGRSPNSLDESSIEADAQGLCRWTWDIGTGGDFVTVEVMAAKKGYEPVSRQLTVKIAD